MNPAAPSLSAAERELFLSSAWSALKGLWPSATTAGTTNAVEHARTRVQFGRVIGPEAALAEPHDGSPVPPTLEYQLRLSLMYVIGGGTNDIQRGLIARGLGLPR
ncbi:MAG TPA: hypothetical protein VMK84_33435 [Streptosporangiaceae bacterium]|nr:hypothetical protein [Streptosporangiaceae bacterium]